MFSIRYRGLKKKREKNHLAFLYIPSPSVLFPSLSLFSSDRLFVSPGRERRERVSICLSASSSLHPSFASHPLPLSGILVHHRLSDASLSPSHQFCLGPTVKWNFEWASNEWKDWNMKKVSLQWLAWSKLFFRVKKDPHENVMYRTARKVIRFLSFALFDNISTLNNLNVRWLT